MNVLNMLNTKYIIAEEEGKIFPFTNTDANGNAWFVEKLNEVQTANQEIKALDSLNTRREAVYVTTQAIEANNGFHVDSLANIALKEYKPNYIKYQSNNANSGFAVFSEIYYGKGWNAYINGELKNHYRVDYVLRGMEVPKGKNTIEFKFEPQVVQTGSNIALASSILFGLVLLGGLFLGVKKK